MQDQHTTLNHLVKMFNNKHYALEERYHELRQQHDRVQFELKQIKALLAEICDVVAPHRATAVKSMLVAHDRAHRTLYSNGAPPFNSIRFEHQLHTDLGPGTWNNIF